MSLIFLVFYSSHLENEYTNLEMFVSRRKPTSTYSDLVWHISHYERLTAVKLLGNDKDTRSGGFYVTVYGWCTENDQCTDLCTCAPCSNLKDADYTLKVSDDIHYNYTDDSLMYLDPCTSDNTCESTCSYATTTTKDGSSSSSKHKLSTSAIIGIVFGCVGFVLLIAIGLYLMQTQMSKSKVSE